VRPATQARFVSRSALRFSLLVIVLLALFALACQPARRVDLDLTAPGNEKFLDHFYPVENGARWTEARSTIWLPDLGGGNLPWRIAITLSAPRPGRFDTAAHVKMRVNGEAVTEFDVRNLESDNEAKIRPWLLGVNGDLLLEIESTVFQPSSSEEKFGIRVSKVSLTRGNGIALPSARGFLFAIALVGCCAGILRMAANSGLMSIRSMTLREFINPFRNRWAWLLVAIWLAVAVSLSWNCDGASWWLQTITVGLLFSTALIWTIARIVSGSLTREQVCALMIVFVIAAVIRISLDFGSGYEGNIASYGKEGDIATYMALAWKTAGHGIHSGYVQVEGSPPSDNPPVLLYPFWLVGRIYLRLFSPLFGQLPVSYPNVLRFMLRLPALAADLLAGAIVFHVLRQQSSITFRDALFAAGAYLFNPAVIFDSAYWGQTQAVHALFMLLCLAAIHARAYHWGGAALAAAILTKPQAFSIAPVVLLLTLRERGALRLVAGGAVAALFVMLPFLFAGNSATVFEEYTQTTKFHPFVAVNAHNFWWFVTGGNGWSPDTNSVGPFTLRVAGLLLFTCAVVLSLAVVWRDREKLFLVAAYDALAFFMLNTQIHEDHLLAMFAPLVVASAVNHEAWWLYCAFAITSLTNMIFHDPKLFAFLGYPVREIYGGSAWAAPRWINSAIQTLLFAAFTAWLAILLMPKFSRKRLSA
jgi:Gpi18-like mannosyltransferase